MKVLFIGPSKLQAQFLVNQLNVENIEAHIRGAREYASIVTGADLGRFEVLVAETDWLIASQVLKQFIAQSNEPLESSEDLELKDPSPYLRKAYFFCLLGTVMLPGIFHYFSMLNFIQFYKLSPAPRPFASGLY